MTLELVFTYFHSSKRRVFFYWGMCFYWDIYSMPTSVIVVYSYFSEPRLMLLKWTLGITTHCWFMSQIDLNGSNSQKISTHPSTFFLISDFNFLCHFSTELKSLQSITLTSRPYDVPVNCQPAAAAPWGALPRCWPSAGWAVSAGGCQTSTPPVSLLRTMPSPTFPAVRENAFIFNNKQVTFSI